MNSDLQPPQVDDSTMDDSTPDDEVTGLPALPTWRRVYWFVVVVFVAYVLLLSALSRGFN
jgi:hypothetical protein